jgi:hypothetical protein
MATTATAYEAVMNKFTPGEIGKWSTMAAADAIDLVFERLKEIWQEERLEILKKQFAIRDELIVQEVMAMVSPFQIHHNS